MFEILNKFDKETVTKENNISLTRDSTSAPPLGNVDYLDEIDTSLMIEADVPKNHWKI